MCSTYGERLRREHGAQLVRVRWYGRRVAEEPAEKLWVERKTHRERWTGQSSVKAGLPRLNRRYECMSECILECIFDWTKLKN